LGVNPKVVGKSRKEKKSLGQGGGKLREEKGWGGKRPLLFGRTLGQGAGKKGGQLGEKKTPAEEELWKKKIIHSSPKKKE